MFAEEATTPGVVLEDSVIGIENSAGDERMSTAISKLFGTIILRDDKIMWIGLNKQDVIVATLDNSQIDQQELHAYNFDNTGKRSVNLDELRGGEPLQSVEYVVPLGVPLQETQVSTQYTHDGRQSDVVFSVDFPPIENEEFQNFSNAQIDIRFSLDEILELFKTGNVFISGFSLPGEKQQRTFFILPNKDNPELGYALFFHEQSLIPGMKLGSLTVAAKFIETLIQGAVESLSLKKQRKVLAVINQLRQRSKSTSPMITTVAKMTGFDEETLLKLSEIRNPSTTNDVHFFEQVFRELQALLHIDELPGKGDPLWRLRVMLRGGYENIIDELSFSQAGEGAVEARLLKSKNNTFSQLESGRHSNSFLDSEGDEFFSIDKKLLDRKGNVKWESRFIENWMIAIANYVRYGSLSYDSRDRALEKVTQVIVFLRSDNPELATKVKDQYDRSSKIIFSNLISFHSSAFRKEKKLYSASLFNKYKDVFAGDWLDQWLNALTRVFPGYVGDVNLEEYEYAHNELKTLQANKAFASLLQKKSLEAIFRNIMINVEKHIGIIKHGETYMSNPDWIGFFRYNYDDKHHEELPRNIGEYLNLDPESPYFQFDKKMVRPESEIKIIERGNYQITDRWLQELEYFAMQNKEDRDLVFTVLQKILLYANAKERATYNNGLGHEGHVYRSQENLKYGGPGYDLGRPGLHWYGRHQAYLVARRILYTLMLSVIYPSNLNGKSIFDYNEKPEDNEKIMNQLFSIEGLESLQDTRVLGYFKQDAIDLKVIGNTQIEINDEKIFPQNHLIALWLDFVFQQNKWKDGVKTSPNQLKLMSIINAILEDDSADIFVRKIALEYQKKLKK